MKIIYFAHQDWENEYVKPLLPGIELATYKGALQDYPEVSDSDAEVLCVFVDSRVGDADLARFPKLKLIATRSTGYDHIDLAAAKARGIAVATVPAYGQNTVAEFAFALLLALSRKIVEAHERVTHEGKFTQDGLEGFDLMGKTLGLVGCGRIGVHVATIAKGFGMQVVVYDPHEDAELAKRIGFTYAPLDSVLSSSDVLSLHVPYMPATRHLINKSNIGKIKRGAYLINTARGGIIETSALIEALQEGILAGAGLDVLEEEGEMGHEEKLLIPDPTHAETMQTLLANHYLMEHPRVIVTPHVAFNTREAMERILGTTAQNIRSFAEGRPQNIVE